MNRLECFKVDVATKIREEREITVMSDVMHHVSCVTVVPGVAGPNFGGPKDARPNGVEYFDPRLGTYIYIPIPRGCKRTGSTVGRVGRSSYVIHDAIHISEGQGRVGTWGFFMT